jgi:hypothetical protein
MKLKSKCRIGVVGMFFFVYLIQKNLRELDTYHRFMSTQNSASSTRVTAEFAVILNVGGNYKGVMSP